MNVKAVVPLIAGLGIGGVALKLGLSTLQRAQAGHRPAAKITIWAAREDIPRGSDIREEMIQPMEFPAEILPTGAFQEKDKLVGRTPRMVAPAGLPVLENMLAPPGCPPGVNPKPGFRAIAVTIDAGSGVDYHLEPGCFVDVVGSFRARNETVAKTIVENAEVAAVGPRISPATGKVEEGKDRVQSVRAVTLYVRPEQVKKILLAEQHGRIKLSLRGSEDTGVVKDGPVDFERDVLELEPKEAEEPSALAKSANPSDFLKNLLGPKPAEPAPVLAAAAPPAPPVETWTTRVHSGQRVQSFEFKTRDSAERVEKNAPIKETARPGEASKPVATEPQQAPAGGTPAGGTPALRPGPGRPLPSGGPDQTPAEKPAVEPTPAEPPAPAGGQTPAVEPTPADGQNTAETKTSPEAEREPEEPQE
ncbi:MAG: Flp pilus assembly protein CpaB [Planctomycetota bacterium]